MRAVPAEPYGFGEDSGRGRERSLGPCGKHARGQGAGWRRPWSGSNVDPPTERSRPAPKRPAGRVSPGDQHGDGASVSPSSSTLHPQIPGGQAGRGWRHGERVQPPRSVLARQRAGGGAVQTLRPPAQPGEAGVETGPGPEKEAHARCALKNAILTDGGSTERVRPRGGISLSREE